MKVKIVTTTEPPSIESDAQGIYRRLGLFVSALGTLASEIDIAHLVPREGIPPDDETYRIGLDHKQSEYWGCPVRITLIPRRKRRQTLKSYYFAGMLRASEQPSIYSFAGAEQAAAVGQFLDQEADIVFVHRLPAMCAVLRSGRRPRRVFFDLDDVEHLVRLRWCLHRPLRPGKFLEAAQIPALVMAEIGASAVSHLMFVCSENDRRQLRWLGIRNVAVIQNSVQVPPSPPPVASDPTLLFLGACNYEPNIQAVERLVTRIIPLVRLEIPEARLLIAGKESDALRARFGDDGGACSYLGFVRDLDGLYASAKVVCCPITQGGGTRVKLVEAAAYARAMVATSFGADGLNFIDGKEILLRDTDYTFAKACVRLLRDTDYCIRLGQAARAKAIQLWDRNQVCQSICEIMREQ